LEAAAIEIEQLGHVLFRLGSGSAAESCGGRDRTADACGCGHKLEQIKSDVFIAAGAKARAVKNVHTE
jgi:hypothetical protein